MAEKFYNDPYKWLEIAKRNNLSQPDIIHPGNQLIVPALSQAPATNLPKTGISDAPEGTVPTSKAITTDTYTVQKGDYLWDIAVRAYGDGFMIGKIIQANNIAQPNLIFSGDVLKIPR
jgi:nucleoid-associated protein YgaU